MREVRTGPHALYKGRFFIIFYTIDDQFVNMFDNVREILLWQKRELTRQNVNLLNVELYRALNGTHLTKCLTGELMKVYAIDENEGE
jgi:hypothetical protein